MKKGLAGTGVKDDWRVEIDELIDLGLYGIIIANRYFTLQLFEVPTDQIRYLLSFLKTCQQDERFNFRNAFGGKVDFVHHDGAVFLNILHNGEHGSNLLQVAIEHAECDKLSAALDEAITEAALPE